MLWQPLFGQIVDVESLQRRQIFSDFLEISFVAKLVQKLCYILMGQIPSCEALLYSKSNLPVLAVTTSKDFKIGPSTTEIRGVSKSPRTLNNPVHQSDARMQAAFYYYGKSRHEVPCAYEVELFENMKRASSNSSIVNTDVTNFNRTYARQRAEPDRLINIKRRSSERGDSVPLRTIGALELRRVRS